MSSLEYLKALAELAKDVVQVERVIVPKDEHDLGRAALTELFESTKTPDTPVIVGRIVADIDAIVERCGSRSGSTPTRVSGP
jgi:type I restriction enzyme R subunit